MEGSHASTCSLMMLATILVSMGKYQNIGTLIAPVSVPRKDSFQIHILMIIYTSFCHAWV